MSICRRLSQGKPFTLVQSGSRGLIITKLPTVKKKKVSEKRVSQLGSENCNLIPYLLAPRWMMQAGKLSLNVNSYCLS